MDIERETIEESKELIKKLRAEESRDISATVQEVEAKILLEFEEYERHRRLRHTREQTEHFNNLERLYLAQSAPRRAQMSKIEELKSLARLLHAPYTDRMLRDLRQDILDLIAKRSVYGQDDRSFDRETGEHLILVTHNLKAVANALSKVQSAIAGIREGSDRLDLDALRKIFLVGHEGAGARLKDEEILTSQSEYQDLVGVTKQELPRFTEMVLPEMVVEAQVTKTVAMLEGLKNHFQ